MRDALGRIGNLVVFGGTSEIGLAIARRLVASRGVEHLVLACRDPDEGAKSAADLEDDGVSVTAVRFDALDHQSHAGVVDDITSRFGDVDVAVIAFGVLGEQAQLEHDADAAVGLGLTNYVGAVSVLTVLADRLEAQTHGTLIVMSSVAGERARRDNYVYGSSKAGLDAFSQGLADRLEPVGVDVLVVRPGFVKSRMTRGMAAAPFATTPEAVALEVMRGLDRGRRTIWVPPILRWVMFVFRHLPRSLARRLAR